MYEPFKEIFGGYGPNDGTVDFYTRVQALADHEKVLLDVGAGRAAWFEEDLVAIRRAIRLMKGKFGKVYAADVDSAVLNNRTADECLVMKGDEIPLEAELADVVLADYVLEHVDNPEAFAQEVDRVLKPGGWFCARTPHKYNYVCIAAKLVKNVKHSTILRWVQPNRKETDVFPTRYKLNSLRDVRRTFRNYGDESFLRRSDPSYYFGNKATYMVLDFLHRVMPSSFSGNLVIFLRKPGGHD